MPRYLPALPGTHTDAPAPVRSGLLFQPPLHPDHLSPLPFLSSCPGQLSCSLHLPELLYCPHQSLSAMHGGSQLSPRLKDHQGSATLGLPLAGCLLALGPRNKKLRVSQADSMVWEPWTPRVQTKICALGPGPCDLSGLDLSTSVT